MLPVSTRVWPGLNGLARRMVVFSPDDVDDPVAAQSQWQASSSDRARPFLQALQQPDRTLQLMLLGRAYLAQNDLALAQRAFDEASTINPGYAEAQAFAGFVRDQRGADGRAWLDRAVELDPNLIVARYFRARHLWERADLGGALDDLNYAIERDPANPEHLLTMRGVGYKWVT